MPIYEYKCKECGHVFEKLVSISSTEDIACQQCSSTNIRKLISGGISMGSETADNGGCQPRGGFT